MFVILRKKLYICNMNLNNFLKNDKIDIELCYDYIRKYDRCKEFAYTDEPYYVENHIKSYFQPPVVLEEKFQISGISQQWNMPFEETNNNIELLLSTLQTISTKYKTANNILDKLFDIFIENNDLLNKDIFLKNKWHVMLGCTSSFNYSDIFDFLTIGGGYLRSDEYKNRKLLLEKNIKYDIQYVPSEETLTKIEELLQNYPQ